MPHRAVVRRRRGHRTYRARRHSLNTSFDLSHRRSRAPNRLRYAYARVAGRGHETCSWCDNHQTAQAGAKTRKLLGLPRVIHSAIATTKDFTAVARVLVIKRWRDPARTTCAAGVKKPVPTDPQHCRCPTMPRTRLWRLQSVSPCQNRGRLPGANQISADQPEDIAQPCRLPSNSQSLCFGSSFQPPFIQASTPQTMWASGK